MKTKLVSVIAIAILSLGVAIPLTSIQNAHASDYLALVGVNKLSSDEITSCDNMANVASVVGGGGDGPLGVQNCSTAPTDGSIYSRNTVFPYTKILKSTIANDAQIDLRLFDTGEEENSLLDHYTYTVHDLDTIDVVQIRLCSGPITDSICSTRVISEQ